MNAYIVEAVRTAGGRRAGKLGGWHPADMAGEVLNLFGSDSPPLAA
jgi:acetyl-CoA C-acetyltransferase